MDEPILGLDCSFNFLLCTRRLIPAAVRLTQLVRLLTDAREQILFT